MSKRKRGRTAYLVPDTFGTWRLIHRGATLLSGVDRLSAMSWASSRGLRIRAVRLAAAQ